MIIKHKAYEISPELKAELGKVQTEQERIQKLIAEEQAKQLQREIDYHIEFGVPEEIKQYDLDELKKGVRRFERIVEHYKNRILELENKQDSNNP